VLQHGSVLLARSKAAPELDGLEEVTGTGLSAATLMRSWLEKLAEHLHFECKEKPLSSTEQTQADAIAKAKFESEAWVKYKARYPQRASY
jgi:hypothetical protein